MANLHEAFAFPPPDDQAMIGLLERKVNGMPIPETYPILERNLSSAAPWDIFKEDDPWADSGFPNKKIVIVFSKLTFVSHTKNRVVRYAGCGTWESRAVTQKIKNSSGEVIGHKKSFTFKPYKSVETEMGRKGCWIMHEYSLAARENRSDLVICRISKEPPKDELKEAGQQDQVLSTTSTVSVASTNTEMRRKRKSPIDKNDHEHQQQSKERNTTEERVNQYAVPYFPVPNQESKNQENLSADSTDPNMYEMNVNQRDQVQCIQEDDGQQVIPYSSEPLPFAVIPPGSTIPIQSFAPFPWANLNTTNADNTGKNPKSGN